MASVGKHIPDDVWHEIFLWCTSYPHPISSTTLRLVCKHWSDIVQYDLRGLIYPTDRHIVDVHAREDAASLYQALYARRCHRNLWWSIHCAPSCGTVNMSDSEKTARATDLYNFFCVVASALTLDNLRRLELHFTGPYDAIGWNYLCLLRLADLRAPLDTLHVSFSQDAVQSFGDHIHKLDRWPEWHAVARGVRRDLPLRRLHLVNVPFSTMGDLIEQTKLESLTIAMSGFSTAPHLEYSLWKQSGTLQYLSLSFCKHEDRALIGMLVDAIEFPQLEHLRLEGAPAFVIFVLRCIASAPNLRHLAIVDSGHHDLCPHLIRMIAKAKCTLRTFEAGFPELTSWRNTGSDAEHVRASSGGFSVENAHWTNELMKCMPELTDLSLGPSALMLFLFFFACEDNGLRRERSALLENVSALRIPSVTPLAATYLQRFLECRKEAGLPILQRLKVEDIGLSPDSQSFLEFEVGDAADFELGLARLSASLHLDNPDLRLVEAFLNSTLFQRREADPGQQSSLDALQVTRQNLGLYTNDLNNQATVV